jgi:hypothetical protein
MWLGLLTPAPAVCIPTLPLAKSLEHLSRSLFEKPIASVQFHHQATFTHTTRNICTEIAKCNPVCVHRSTDGTKINSMEQGP